MATGCEMSAPLGLAHDREHIKSSKLVTFLFELGWALAVPPNAQMAPPRGGRPIIHTEPDTLLTPGEVAAALGRPATEVARGRVSAGELDWRLEGLEVSLAVFRGLGERGELVSLSVIRPDPRVVGPRGATTADLWRLATSTVAQCGVATEHRVDLGDDGFLALHGGRTVQVAWLAGARVATVTVTCLAGDKSLLMEEAQAIAALMADRLDPDSSAPRRVPK